MRRRELILALRSALVISFAGAARAQPTRRLVAILAPGSGTGEDASLLQEAVSELGYRSQNLAVEVRAAGGDMALLPELARELVRLTPDVIVAGGAPAAQAALQATATIPIIMMNVADPIAAGLVASLAHPGGTVTGIANLAQETVGKRLQLLKALVPNAVRIAVLHNPSNAGNMTQLQAAREAAPSLGIELLPIAAGEVGRIDGAFAVLTAGRAEGVFVPDDPVFALAADRIVARSITAGIPTIFQSRRFASAGGMMSYGTDLGALYRQVAVYVDKILKGAKPADLPVAQPTKFELVINLKTAKALGLTVPSLLLAQADEVIE